MRRRLLFLALLPALGPVGRADDVVLRLASPEKTVTFTAGEFAALPHTEMKVLEPHARKERTYAGVAMRELLAKVGVPAGEGFRGPQLQRGVLVRAQDGYAVLFALAEFDANFSSRSLLLADREDGQPVPANAAPFRLIVPGDQRAARWSRQVTSIEIVSVGELAPRPPKP